jgi:hypothetical protein
MIIIIMTDKITASRREIDAPVHRGGYSDGKHIQLVCDNSWVEPKWGRDEDRKTTDPEVYVADDDRLYTFNSEKTTCEGCK